MKPNAAARKIIVPPALSAGDTVGVAAPGSPVDRKGLAAGIERLVGLGLRVRTGNAVHARKGFLAGSDAARAADLAALLEDDAVRAIIFARGGWGTSRLLDRVAWERLVRTPKLLMGYSDLTALFAPVLDRCGIVCIYGPFVTELGDKRGSDTESLMRALFRPREPLELRFGPSQVLAHGRAEGRLAGGCLTLLAHLSGTPYQPSLRGRILLIEEVGEPPYRLDRMLTQMRLAGMLEGVAGVLIGSLKNCVPSSGSGALPTAKRVVASHFEERGIPIVAGLAIGHIDRKISVPLGFRAGVDTVRGRISLEP